LILSSAALAVSAQYKAATVRARTLFVLTPRRSRPSASLAAAVISFRAISWNYRPLPVFRTARGNSPEPDVYAVVRVNRDAPFRSFGVAPMLVNDKVRPHGAL